MSSEKVSVTLTYASKGMQPPVFLAGSFSEPAWHPQEMNFTTDTDGEHQFNKEVEIDEGGEYQYKFRIGLGDWWVLNEQSPTVTDELGNRNNLLVAPSMQEIIKKSKSLESTPLSAEHITPVPELILEKVDDEPRHGDNFGPGASAGQKDAHQMRALDTKPDQVVIRSQTNTPVYANTAAEVADSAAILDREPSPAAVPDEEAGRTGERRVSTTPIPQVAFTAAEVADVAATLDQVEESEDDSLSAAPLFPHESHSGNGTLWHEQAPLFAHECLGPNDGVEIESPIAFESVESPIKEDAVEEVIDLNDPLLEPFPEDRLSILTHIRSCESRMSEDETNVHGVPPSPVTRAKSRSPSIDTPGSARLDAQPSPGLDVIAEEHHDDEYFDELPSPTHKTQGTEQARVSEELNVIQEEEPAEEPKNVLENLRKIEESTNNSNNATTKEESVKTDADEGIPADISSLTKDEKDLDKTNDQVTNFTEMKDALDHSADEVPSGLPTAMSQTPLKGDSKVEDPKTALEGLSPSQISQPLVNIDKTSQTPQNNVPNRNESPHDGQLNNGTESKPNDGPTQEVKMEPKDETHLDSVKARYHPGEEPQEIKEPQELEESNVNHLNGVQKEEILVKDIPKSDNIDVWDGFQASTSQGTIAEHVLKGDASKSMTPHEYLHRDVSTKPDSDLSISKMNIEHVAEEQVEKNSLASDVRKSATEIYDAQKQAERSIEGNLSIAPKKIDETFLSNEQIVLGSKSEELLMSKEVVLTPEETTQGTDFPASMMKVNAQGSWKLEEPALNSEVDTSATVESRAVEIDAGYVENQPNVTGEIGDKILAAHVDPAMSDVGHLNGMLTNDIEAGKSLSDGEPTMKEEEKNSEVEPVHTLTPNTGIPLTPSSTRSPLKVPESENFFQSIWRIVFVEWIGGMLATLCSEEHGPLVAVTLVVIFGPIVAMYFLRPEGA